jgi:hypothetical protein
MKSKISLVIFFAFTSVVLAFTTNSCQAQNDPWTQQQLLAPADLAKTLSNPTAAKPVIFAVGMDPIIKGSIDIGPGMMKDNIAKLKQKLDKMPKNAQIVVYCGCCPFSSCPNIRPAMELLKTMQFTNYKLLNLPQNVKVDWIDKGYPMSE